MTTHHVPKGVSLDTLKRIIAGWEAVGAAVEPMYTSAVEDETGITDAVGRQTRFLEEVGVLEKAGQKQRLTGRGQDLAGALAAEEEERATERASELLSEWPVTEEVRGILRQNPIEEETLVPLVAGITGQDLDASRVRNGITTLLDLYEWAGLLDRNEDGRYRLPDEEPSIEGEKPSEEAETKTTEHSEGVPEAIETAATETEGTTGEPVTAVDEVEGAVPGAEPSDGAETAGTATEPKAVGEDAEAAAMGTDENVESPLEELAEAADISDAEVLLDEITSAAEEARKAAEEAREAAQEVGEASTADDGSASLTAGSASSDSSPDTDHALSLEVNLDADPEDLEPIVRALRRGVIQTEETSDVEAG